MNCQNFENVINELARDQIMEANVREQAVGHCRECESCAATLGEQKKLAQQLNELAAAMHHLSAPSRVEEDLLTAFRSAKVPAASPRKRWQYAIAASVLLAITTIGVIWFISAQEAGPIAVVPVQDSNPPPSKSPAKQDKEDKKETDEPTPRSEPKRSPKARSKGVQRLRNEAVANNRPTATTPDIEEITTEFLPIGYAVAANVQEGGQVVRVELPRYAMARFGLPVNMDRYDERVKADVLLGADGMARAIRFVQ
ncbi:MAG TPA: hypothetical protein VIB00_07225 [Pyrinomonadaceae bacterium]|jgi:hypothetical protein